MEHRDGGLEAFIRSVQLVADRLHRAVPELDQVRAVIATVPALKSRGTVAIACTILLDVLVRILVRHPTTSAATIADAVRVCAHLDLVALSDLFVSSVQHLHAWSHYAGQTSDRRVIQTLQTIHEHYHNPALTIDSVAFQVGVSRWYLDRLLVQATGQTFRKHLDRVRLTHAMQLLTSSFCSVKEATHRSGYGSVESLERAFKRHLGCPPTEWRSAATDRPRNVDE